MRIKESGKSLIRLITVAVMAVLLVLPCATAFNLDTAYAAASDKKAAKKSEAQQQLAPPEIKAGSAIVFAASTSEDVYSYRAERKLQPGALTKLMTAMIVIDNMHSSKEYDMKVDVTADAAAKDPNLPAAGEQIKIEKLLEHMIVNNSDAAAELLVNFSTSSTEVFVNQMNSKVVSIGLLDTQFANVTGAYSELQYSTAKDCAVITQYALRYQPIKELLFEAKNDIDYSRLKGSMNGVLQQSTPLVQYVGIAAYKDMYLVTVMLDADELTRPSEAKKLFEYGYSKVTMNSIIPADKKVGKARIKGGAWTKVAAYTEGKGYAYIPPEGSEALVTTQVVMTDNLQAPLAKGSKVGEYRIYVADELKGTVDLVIKKDVNKGWPLSHFYISNLATVVIAVIVILILLLAFRIINVRRRRAKRKAQKRKEMIRREALRQLAEEEDRIRRGWTYTSDFEKRKTLK